MATAIHGAGCFFLVVRSDEDRVVTFDEADRWLLAGWKNCKLVQGREPPSGRTRDAIRVQGEVMSVDWFPVQLRRFVLACRTEWECWMFDLRYGGSGGTTGRRHPKAQRPSLDSLPKIPRGGVRVARPTVDVPRPLVSTQK